MAQVFINPATPTFNTSSVIAPLAKRYFYLTGTTTLADIFADAAEATPLANPQTANGYGVFPTTYLVDNVAYRVVTRTAAGGLISDVDPLKGGNLSAATGAGLVGYSNTNTYSTGTVGEQLRRTVKTYADTAAAKAASHLLGETFVIDGMAGLWIVQPNVKVQDYFVQWDDELHLQVPVADIGTCVAERQVDTVAEYARQLHTRNYAVAMARVAQSSSLPQWPDTVVLKLAAYGDSITFGQFDGSTTGTTTAFSPTKNGSATGFGDGSTHVHNSVVGPWPVQLKTYLDNVYGTDKFSVQNRGFSGDTVGSGYGRHRVGAGEQLCYIAYGTNDQLFATDNGSDQTGLFGPGADGQRGPFNLSKFVEAYRKFVVRQMLRGSVCILLAPAAHQGATGYDGTGYSSAKMLAYFRTAIFAVGREMGVLVIDLNDVIGQYPITTVYHDGIHPNDFGHVCMGARLAAPIIAKGWTNGLEIAGTRTLTASMMSEQIEGLGALEVTNAPNSNSIARPFYNATESADIIVPITAGSTVFYGFYLAEDQKAVMALGSIAATGSLDYRLDFGIAQPAAKLNTAVGATGDASPRAAFITITSTPGRLLTAPSDLSSHLVIAGKGWHSVQISASTAAFTLAGMLFGDFGDINAAIAAPTGGATVDAESRTAINSLRTALRNAGVVAA